MTDLLEYLFTYQPLMKVLQTLTVAITFYLLLRKLKK